MHKTSAHAEEYSLESRFRSPRSCVSSLSVRVFRSEDLEKLFFLNHLSIDELESVQSCQPLQSGHWQLEVCDRVAVLLSCRRKFSRCHSLAFGKSGRLVVAKVPAPPTAVCIRQYVLFQGSRSASVGTFSLFGPLAMRSHSLTFFGGTFSFSRYRSRNLYLYSKTVQDDWKSVSVIKNLNQ